MAAFRAAALVAAMVTASVAPADALPKFNTPNDFDLDHNVCTRPPKAGVSCPPLCVRNPQTDCPAPYNKCPDGQSLCPSYFENPCTCNADTAALLWEFRPCVLVSVTVPFFDSGNATEATNQLCSMEYGNITATLDSVELPTANLTAGFVTCPVEEAKYTYAEPAFLVSYGILSAVLLLVALWTLFKSTLERSVRLRASLTAYDRDGDKTLTRFFTPDAAERESNGALDEKAADASSTVLDLTDTLIAEDNIIIKGYNNSRFGTFVLTTVVLFAVLLQFVLLLLVLDYYGILLSMPDGSMYSMGMLTARCFSRAQFSQRQSLTPMRPCRPPRPRLDGAPQHQFRCCVACDIVLAFGFALRGAAHPQFLPPASFANRGPLRPGVQEEGPGDPSQRRRKAPHLAQQSGGPRCQSYRELLRFVEFQCTRYVYDENSERFDPYQFDLGSTQAEVLAQKDGLDTAEHQIRYELLGPNFISVEVGSFWRAMAQEFSSPFYLYQLMCLWVWYYFAYFNMGLVQTCVILISAVIKVILRLRSEQRVKEMAEFSTEVNVFRNGLWSMASSTSLVPGDIFEVENKALMPCDAAVLSGTVVCDESNLTGEALPVRKFPLKNEEVAYEKSTSGKLHTLFDGSKVLQVLPAEGVEKVTALVLGTGTASDKGRLIHHILFPAPVSFIFNEHLKVVIAILLAWGCIAMGLSIWLMGLSEGSAITAWFYGLFVISQVLSPLIPAALVVGQSVAAPRLRTKGIFCIDLPRIIIAGKCRIFCFDKTGTLTRNGLEWEAFRPVEIAAGATPAFGQPLEKFGDVSDTVKMGLSTCHAVGKVNGELIGNPVDIEMFRGTGCTIEAATGAGVLDVVTPSTPAGPEQAPPPPYEVIKRFEFVHVRMSMSVAVLDTANGHVHIFVKGSFENVRGYADPESVPQDYDRVASQHAKEGCYVLALAHRELGAIDPAVVRSWTREEFETKVRLCGLILFRNKLKHDTKEAIADLTAGDCRPVMITGDNTLTGVHIARACGMVATSTRIVLGDATPGSEVLWRDFETWEP
ncbi:MAG: E1-E2 ATPase-domain-containing protein, partial [Olpidium bornovanus]